MPRFQAPRGTQDILPAQQPYWQRVLTVAQETVRLFGFRRIDTPIFESAALFEKGSGDTTDVVEKEMYVFEDRGGDLLALTPEGTPAICRAYLEHGMASWPQPVRLWTTHPMFRYDRPQRGRYRQHTQIDCEIIGSASPLADAEAIELLWTIYERLGLRNLEVRLSSIDDPEPRRAYVAALKEYYRPFLERLSEDSRRRFERNPLRLLDSKDERDLPFKEGAPKLVDRLSPAARDHFEAVQRLLQAAGIPYRIDPLLVRGLDYYNRTVFEVVPLDDERAQSTVGGGGRYDGLIELLGGPPTPAVGFGTGIERIILEMERNGIVLQEAPTTDLFVAVLGEAAALEGTRAARKLRAAGLATVVGEPERSLKAQLRTADRLGAAAAVIIGEDEIRAGVAVLKPLRDERPQEEVPLHDLVERAAAFVRAR
ncbi:Histidine--tRNA ligase [bacterium HR29]|nr:Histidine--tRNA ligase [bacterium HR29]